MKPLSLLYKSVLAGAVSGTLILGIAYRFITIYIAYLKSAAINLTVRNMYEVLFVSAVVGILGGIIFTILNIIFTKMSVRVKSFISAGILFVSLSLIQTWRGMINLSLLPIQITMFLLTIIMFAIYSLLMALLIRKQLKE
jgi:hypothetical protein